MNKICLLWLLILGLGINPAGADFAVFQEKGPQIVPLNSGDIALERETLKLRMDYDTTRLEAKFQLRNLGETQTLKVGLPQIVSADDSPGLKNLRVKAGWRRVKLSRESGFYDPAKQTAKIGEGKTAKKLAFPLPLGTLNLPGARLEWITWEFKLKAGKTQTFTVSFEADNLHYQGRIPPNAIFYYLLTTAQFWQEGEIKDLHVEADFSQQFALSGFFSGKGWLGGGNYYLLNLQTAGEESLSPDGYRAKRGRLVWDFAPFAAKQDLVIPASCFLALHSSSVYNHDLQWGPQKALDADSDTAWIPQHPTGDFLDIPLCFPEDYQWDKLPYELKTPGSEKTACRLGSLQILGGASLNSRVYYSYNRPKKIRVETLSGIDEKLPKFSREYLLQDNIGFQEIKLPAELKLKLKHRLPVYHFAPQLRITILEVYPGRRYNETPLAEVRLSK